MKGIWLVVWLALTALQNSTPSIRGIIQSLTMSVTSFSLSFSSASIPSSAVRILYLSARLPERKFNISSLSSTISMAGLCLIEEPERLSCKMPSGIAGLFNRDVLASCDNTCACSTGRVTIKEDPLLTSDSTSMQPLCDSTMLLTMLRPIPVPGLLSIAW